MSNKSQKLEAYASKSENQNSDLHKIMNDPDKLARESQNNHSENEVIKSDSTSKNGSLKPVVDSKPKKVSFLDRFNKFFPRRPACRRGSFWNLLRLVLIIAIILVIREAFPNVAEQLAPVYAFIDLFVEYMNWVFAVLMSIIEKLLSTPEVAKAIEDVKELPNIIANLK